MLHALALSLALAPPQVTDELQIAWSLDTAITFSEALTPEGDLVFLESLQGFGGPWEVRSVSPDGQPQWSAPVPMQPGALTAHVDGRVTVVGIIPESAPGFPAAPTPGGDDFGLIEFDGDGNELSRRRLGGPFDELYGVIGADGAGGVFLVGGVFRTDLGPTFASGVPKLYVARLDATGALAWETTLLGSFPDSDELSLRSADFDAVGGVVLSAERRDAFSTSTPLRYSLWRLDPSGGQVYFRPNFSRGFRRMSLDAQGRIFGSWDVLDPMGNYFSGFAYVDPNGVSVWDDIFGACGHQAAGIDSQGRLWAYLRESSNPFSCSPFGNTGPAVLRRIRVTGSLAERVELPMTQTSVTIGPNDRVFGSTDPGSALVRLTSLEEPSVVTCASVPNSTGQPGLLTVVGSDVAADNDVLLAASSLPPGATTLFVTSFSSGFAPNPGGSDGDLCLGGSIGRFAGPSMLRTSTAQGRAALGVDLTDLPIPPGQISATAGQALYFQAWYRDSNPTATSNFTSAAAVTLR